MDIPDGRIFITRLAQWVRNNDKALSSSTPRRPGFDPVARSTTLDSRPSTAPLISSKTSNSFVSSFTFGFRERPTSNRLYLTPNQIYYLLSRFEELGVVVGPMDVRMENIELNSTPSNYVSFLTHTKRPKHRTADQESLHSVSSVRSVVSSISSLWSNLGMSTGAEQKEEKRFQQERVDLKYLYTAMTLVPSVKFALDHRISRIIGFEEFPFDTAVPLWNFKSLSVLEIVDLDFRAFYGWDRLAEQLRSLTLKRAGVDDLTDLLAHIVLDDIDRRRRRSAKSPSSPVMAFSSSSPAKRKAELARVNSAYSYAVASESPSMDMQRQASETSAEESATTSRPATHTRLDSTSPPPTASGRRGSAFLSGAKHPGKARRSSSSSSSNARYTPRTSSLNLLQFSGLPPTKWRFLKHLSLPENGLTSVPPLILLPLAQTLQSLDLTGNLFTEVPESLSMLVSLRALNLTGCIIESLNSLARNPLPAITVLNLSNNRLRSLAGIDRLYSLERVDVRGNQLTDPSELARLTGMPDLRDVFVNKNPFTKTHPNFRVQIFNLFRRTPGYVADITIDLHGPSYSERKHLVERAPERVSVPVIKPPHEDEVPQPVEDGDKASSSAPNPRETSGYQVNSTSSDPSTPPRVKTKRRAHRRRVVDMSQSESPRSLHAYGSSPDTSKSTVYQSPTTTLRKVVAAEEDDTPYQPGTYQGDSRTATPTSPMPVTPTQEERPDLGLRLSSEQYRSKIEALKLEHGSHWLSALNNESHPFYQGRNSSSVGVSRAVT